MPGSKDARNLETLEVLAGQRPKNKPKAAVRIEDLDGLLKIDDKLQSAAAAGSTPTKAEFDALVDDVAMMHRRLVAVMKTLRDRLI